MLTTVKLKLKPKGFTKSPPVRFDVEKRANRSGKFAALPVLDSDVDTRANSLKEVLLSTAEEVLWRQRKKIEPWVTNEVLHRCYQNKH